MPELKSSDYEKLRQVFNNAEATADEQKRIKIAFVEGYESGLQRQMRGRTVWLKFMQNMITASAVILILWLYRMYKGKHCIKTYITLNTFTLFYYLQLCVGYLCYS